MPVSAIGQAPYAPSGMPSDFDAQMNASARQRKLAEMLQQQAFTPDMAGLSTPGAKMSWLQPLAAMAKMMAANHINTTAGAADKEGTDARQAAFTKLLGEMPQGTPGTPENAPPVGPLAPLEGDTSGAPPPPGAMPDAAPKMGAMGPVQPATAAVPPTPMEMAQYGAKFLPLGPAAAKMGGTITDEAVKSMLPKQTPGLMVAGGDIFDPVSKKFYTGPTTEARSLETQQVRIDRTQQAIDKLDEQARQADQSDATKKQLAADANALRRELHTMMGGNAVGNLPTEGFSKAGNVVVRGAKDGIAREVINGVPSKEPYGGPITPKVDQAQGVKAASTGTQGIKDMEELLAATKDDKKVYGARAAGAAMLPSIGGLSVAASGLDDEQLKTRTKAANMTANITHSMYGTAFSANEAKQATEYLIKPTDGARDVKRKLEGRIALEKTHMEGIPESARNASSQRKSGGTDDAALLDKYGAK